MKRNTLFLIIGGLAVGISAAFFSGGVQKVRQVLAGLGPKVDNLHPRVREAAARVLEDAAAEFAADGLTVGIFDGWRSLDEQRKYMKSGTSWVADPRDSYHAWGLAVDFVFINQFGAWTWLDKEPGQGMDKWQRLGAIIERHGFEWGGRWGSQFDGPHGQMKLADLSALKVAHADPLEYIATFTA